MYRICCTAQAGLGEDTKTCTPPTDLLSILSPRILSFLLSLTTAVQPVLVTTTCKAILLQGSVVGNDDMPMDDDIDEQEKFLSIFSFLCFQTCVA